MLSGKDKKINVLNQIRKVLGEEVYHRYEPLLMVSIEFLYKNMVQCKSACVAQHFLAVRDFIQAENFFQFLIILIRVV